jgi:hypothetical protein
VRTSYSLRPLVIWPAGNSECSLLIAFSVGHSQVVAAQRRPDTQTRNSDRRNRQCDFAAPATDENRSERILHIAHQFAQLVAVARHRHPQDRLVFD